MRFQRADVTAGLIETLGMEMKAGRPFSEAYGTDTNNIIINEAGIKAIRMKNPVGKTFTLWGNKMQIIGVVKDFGSESMRKKVDPCLFAINLPMPRNCSTCATCSNYKRDR